MKFHNGKILQSGFGISSVFHVGKVVAEYFEWYNEECITELIDYLYSAWDCYNDENSFAKLKDLNLHLREIMEKKTEKVKSVMYKLK